MILLLVVEIAIFSFLIFCVSGEYIPSPRITSASEWETAQQIPSFEQFIPEKQYYVLRTKYSNHECLQHIFRRKTIIINY